MQSEAVSNGLRRRVKLIIMQWYGLDIRLGLGSRLGLVLGLVVGTLLSSFRPAYKILIMRLMDRASRRGSGRDRDVQRGR